MQTKQGLKALLKLLKTPLCFVLAFYFYPFTFNVRNIFNFYVYFFKIALQPIIANKKGAMPSISPYLLLYCIVLNKFVLDFCKTPFTNFSPPPSFVLDKKLNIFASVPTTQYFFLRKIDLYIVFAVLLQGLTNCLKDDASLLLNFMSLNISVAVKPGKTQLI